MKGATATVAEGASAAREGRFKAVATLSERGMFGTYLVEDTRFGRRVALRKPLSGIAITPDIAGRVHDEARLRARCAGVRVLPLYEDRSAEADASYVFAAPAGPSLLEVSRRLGESGGPEAGEVIAVFSELASILREAHEAGVVLGELDLSAVHCTEERGLVLLAMDHASAEDVPLSRRVSTTEDPAHRSPEQGMGVEATAASDVFLAGLATLELAVGAHPFAGEGGEMTHAIRTRPPAAVPRTVGLPVELERLVARCLAKDASSRPESGGALVAELAALAPSTPPAASIRRMLERCGLAGKATRAATRVEAELRRDEAYAPVERAKRVLVAAAVAMVAIGGAGRLWEKQSQRERPAAATTQSARLFVLARPWAEVWVDGEAVETTPLARPIVLAAGKHVVVFKHPGAPEEKRFIELAPGETTTLDIEMAVRRAAPRSSAEDSP